MNKKVAQSPSLLTLQPFLLLYAAWQQYQYLELQEYEIEIFIDLYFPLPSCGPSVT